MSYLQIREFVVHTSTDLIRVNNLLKEKGELIDQVGYYCKDGVDFYYVTYWIEQ